MAVLNTGVDFLSTFNRDDSIDELAEEKSGRKNIRLYVSFICNCNKEKNQIIHTIQFLSIMYRFCVSDNMTNCMLKNVVYIVFRGDREVKAGN